MSQLIDWKSGYATRVKKAEKVLGIAAKNKANADREYEAAKSNLEREHDAPRALVARRAKKAA